MHKITHQIDIIILGILVFFLIFVPYNSTIVKVCICAAFFLWVLKNIVQHRKNFVRKILPTSSLNMPIFFFLAAASLSTIFSADPYHSQSILFERYLPYAFLFWISLSVTRNTSRSLKVVLYAVIFSSAFFGVGGAWDYLLWQTFRFSSVFGFNVPFGMFPAYLVFYIPFMFALVIFAKKPMKLFAFISFASLCLCWIWQGSRMAWIAVPLGLLTIAFIKNKRLFAILLVICAISVILFPAAQIERAKELFSAKTWVLPYEFWSIAVEIFKDHPVVGAGLGMYENLFMGYRAQLGFYTAGQKFLHAHNTYLEILCEMGIVGLIAFLSIFYVFLKRAYYTIQHTFGFRQGVVIGFVGTIVATLFFCFWMSMITVGTQSSPLFWALLGIASSLLTEPKKEINGKA